MERKEKMQDREKGEDAGRKGWREWKGWRERRKRRKMQERKEKAQHRNKKIYPFGCNINYFSYICTRKGIIISNVYL